ncbi:MAG: N-acetylmuramoyl-L-alanine amidase, partial [Pseudomonadota bacterium]
GIHNKQDLRIVFDLENNPNNQPAQYEHNYYIIPKSQVNKFDNIIINIQNKTILAMKEPPTPLLKENTQQNVTTNIAPNITQYITNNISPQNNLSIIPKLKPQKYIITIDAGHGGKDPGAIGISGAKEKDINLKFALIIKELIESSDDYEVILTRESDYFLSLNERAKKALENNSDLFLSIHADSHRDKNVAGFGIYTLSEIASDKEAARLARRENLENILGDNIVETTLPYNRQVKDVLIDLIQRDTKNKSSIIAEQIINDLPISVNKISNTHRFAGFRVLKSHNIPSILIELGYLSNKNEERKLRQEKYLRKIAQSITKSLDMYFSKIDNYSEFR